MIGLPFGEFDGPKLKQLNPVQDLRGTLYRLFELSSLPLDALNDSYVAVSDNPRAGTLRGLHIQIKPLEESKIITCLAGSIYDVIVDLRPNSETYLRWTAITLRAEELHQLYIPSGFAHGFQTLENYSIVSYLIMGKFSPTHSRRIHYKDQKLNIVWPLEVSRISEEDRDAQPINNLLSELI